MRQRATSADIAEIQAYYRLERYEDDEREAYREEDAREAEKAEAERRKQQAIFDAAHGRG